MINYIKIKKYIKSINNLTRCIKSYNKKNFNSKLNKGFYDENNDYKMTFQEIVTNKGYKLNSYSIKTKDNYILKIFRISRSFDNLTNSIKFGPLRKVVLLQHGLLDSSDSWISNYENKALPFILVNLGYDVWLGNNRGNKYSRNHATLNPDRDKEYWNFSLHEMGTIDIPSKIDFIINETGAKNITYIGHSQGSAQLFAALSLNNHYFKDKINTFIALGPVTNISHLGSNFLKFMNYLKLDILFLRLNILNEILPFSEKIRKFQVFSCLYAGKICNKIIKIISDSNPEVNHSERLLVFLSNYPSGTSLKSIHHFAENIRNQKFISICDTKVPYDLDKVKNVPICLLVGTDDLLATVNDNRNLREILEKNGNLKFYKEYDDVGHLSFYLSKTNEHVKDIISILNTS